MSKWSIDKNGKLAHVSWVDRGLICGCSCVVCGEKVMARKGEIRGHHFAHTSEKGECPVSLESLLHLAAKEVLTDARGFHVPDGDGELWLDFDEVKVERQLGAIRPDIIGVMGDQFILVEPAVTSFCSEEKKAYIEGQGWSGIEIDLSEFDQVDFDLEEVRTAVVDAIENKRWLVPLEEAEEVIEVEELEQAPQDVDDDLAAAIEKSVSALEPVEDQRKIYGMTCWVKRFADGGMSVKPAGYNPAFAEALKQVRRKFGGWYNPKGHRSNFPAFCADAALAEIDKLPAEWR